MRAEVASAVLCWKQPQWWRRRRQQRRRGSCSNSRSSELCVYAYGKQGLTWTCTGIHSPSLVRRPAPHVYKNALTQGDKTLRLRMSATRNMLGAAGRPNSRLNKQQTETTAYMCPMHVTWTTERESWGEGGDTQEQTGR